MGALRSELEAFRAESARRAPAEAQALIAAQIADLEASGIEDRILPVGARVPDLTLPDATGTLRRLRDLGPAVIVFYRGGWCSYCNLQFRAWQARLPELARHGATLVAISPKAADESLGTVEKNALAFPVLSDSQDLAGRAFGVSYAVPAELIALYERFGHALDIINGAAGWRLPISATFVISGSGRIAFASAEADYRRRVEPEEAIAALARAAEPVS